MKKFIIPIIAAAVLGIGGGAAAVMLNTGASANDNNDDLVFPCPELMTGNYYLDGDPESERI